MTDKKSQQDKRKNVPFYIDKFKTLKKSGTAGQLPGLSSAARIEALARHIVDSISQIDYYHTFRRKSYSHNIIDPTQSHFDPLKAAVMQKRSGNIDEACWLVFLATHCGKHGKNGWSLTQKIYSGGKAGPLWDWSAISANPGAFRDWLLENQDYLSGEKFSNHRKFQNVKLNCKRDMAETFRTYVAWIKNNGGWQAMLDKQKGKGPKELFQDLYHDMRRHHIKEFGRLGRFDYLTMLGDLGIVPIEPDSLYLQDSKNDKRGPLKGARLLFDGNAKSKVPAKELEERITELNKYFDLPMQVWEDALCNWQKNPDDYSCCNECGEGGECAF